jgi:hypothetical protein
MVNGLINKVMNMLHLHFNILFNTINVTNFAIHLFTCYNMDMACYIEHGLSMRKKLIYFMVIDIMKTQ